MTVPAQAIESFLHDREIVFSRTADGWALRLSGEAKHTIPVVLALGDAGLRVESFFMRAPQENAAEVYRLLLARNARARWTWFAVDGLGDVYLAGFVPEAAIGEAALDLLLGELLTTADQMFNAAIERGFASYLAHDLAWRAKQQAR